VHARISIGMCNQCCFLHQWQGVAGTVTENGCVASLLFARGATRGPTRQWERWGATYGSPSIFSSETSCNLIGVRVTVRPPPMARSLASVPASLLRTEDLPADCEPTTTILGRAA
jgi:hypothetical protein